MFDFNHPNPNGWSPASAPHQRLRRSNCSWIAVLGGKTRLRCIQCHDPHSPKFKPMTPLPPLQYPPRGAHPPPKGSSEPDARLAPARREVGAAGAWSPRECLDCSSIGPLLFKGFEHPTRPSSGIGHAFRSAKRTHFPDPRAVLSAGRGLPHGRLRRRGGQGAGIFAR